MNLSYHRSGNQLTIRAFDPDMTLWINGIQVEKGDKATAFQDDTMDIVDALRQGR